MTPRSSSPAPDLALTLVRPARKDEKAARPFPNWLRQRVEAVIWTLKSQLGLERHGGRVPAGLWARVVQRLLALNTVHLAQLAHRRPRQALPDRLRPRVTCPHFPINDLRFRPQACTSPAAGRRNRLTSGTAAAGSRSSRGLPS